MGPAGSKKASESRAVPGPIAERREPRATREMEEESIFALAAARGSPNVVMHDVDTSPRRNRPLPDRPVVLAVRSQHQDSYQVSNLLNPVRGVRDAMRREGKKPRNHAKDNLRAIREQSLQNRLQKELDKKLPAQGSKARAAPPRSKIPQGPTSPAKDFIRQNRKSVQAMRSKKVEKAPEQLFKEKENYGKLPRYLLERKIQLAEEYERRREDERMALAPPGTRVMPEDERLRTLEMLESNKLEVEKHLKLLPFVVETPSQIKAKTQLENRLKEIEDAERMFSRPIVYVKI